MATLKANGAINKIITGLYKFGGTKVGNYLGANVAAMVATGRGNVFRGAGTWLGRSMGANGVLTNSTFLQKAARVGAVYGAASAAGRLASGGGLMRDKNGNFNVIGVPFI
jgi:hypothetical protein